MRLCFAVCVWRACIVYSGSILLDLSAHPCGDSVTELPHHCSRGKGRVHGRRCPWLCDGAAAVPRRVCRRC